MGFLQGLGRILAGKPVFTAEDNNALPPVDNTSSQLDDKTVGAQGRKIIPEIDITRVRPTLSGSNLDVWATIQNTAEVPIFIDKIRFLGQKYELDRYMNPGDSHQCRIYKGSAFTNSPPSDASVDYRLEANGDYFQARFNVDFYVQDDYYLPEDFNRDGSVRDI